MKLSKIIYLLLSLMFSVLTVKAQNGMQTLNFKMDKKKSINKDNFIKNIHSQLKISTDLDLKPNKGVEKDEFGYSHEKYTQYHKGLKVEYSDIRVHSMNDTVVSVNGSYIAFANIDTTKKISKKEAIDKAIRYIGAKKYIWNDESENSWLQKITNDKTASFYPNPELVICKNYFDSKDTNFHLAFKLDIYAVEPLSRTYIFIDAKTGLVLNREAIIKTVDGSGTTRYSGTKTIGTQFAIIDNANTYRLRDYSRGYGIETYNMNRLGYLSLARDFTDSDNYWNEYDNTNKDNGALDAHWGAMMTYDYFKNIHGRNSFNNNGAIIRNYVHYGSNWAQASWDGARFLYGDGDTDFDVMTSLDIVAHEIGHAVCDNTSNLLYQYESGAINEGLSDIWAACVENYAAPDKQTWLIGEDVVKRSGHAVLRSMNNPKAQGQPNTYDGMYWVNQNGCIPDYNNNDYCGVHTNSGIMNYWFYLLSSGGEGWNDKGNCFGVSGIGISKAAKIVYRAETVYMTSSTNYNAARNYTIQAAIDIYGANSPEVISTTDAWYAVGVGNHSSGCTNIKTISDSEYTSNSTSEMVINACYLFVRNVKIKNVKMIIDATNGVEINNFEMGAGCELEIK